MLSSARLAAAAGHPIGLDIEFSKIIGHVRRQFKNFHSTHCQRVELLSKLLRKIEKYASFSSLWRLLREESGPSGEERSLLFMLHLTETMASGKKKLGHRRAQQRCSLVQVEGRYQLFTMGTDFSSCHNFQIWPNFEKSRKASITLRVLPQWSHKCTLKSGEHFRNSVKS